MAPENKENVSQYFQGALAGAHVTCPRAQAAQERRCGAACPARVPGLGRGTPGATPQRSGPFLLPTPGGGKGLPIKSPHYRHLVLRGVLALHNGARCQQATQRHTVPGEMSTASIGCPLGPVADLEAPGGCSAVVTGTEKTPSRV